MQAFVPTAPLEGPKDGNPLAQIAGGLLKVLEAGCVNNVQPARQNGDVPGLAFACQPVVEALGSLPAEYSHNELVGILGGGYSPLAEQWAAYLLVSEQGDIAAAPRLARAVIAASSGDHEPLAMGFGTLYAHGATPQQLQKLAEVLRPLSEDADPSIRETVALALRNNPSPAAIPTFVRLLKDKDEGVRDQAARGLGAVAHIVIPDVSTYAANEGRYLNELTRWAAMNGYEAN
jgi:hypothetical protein